MNPIVAMRGTVANGRIAVRGLRGTVANGRIAVRGLRAVDGFGFVVRHLPILVERG